MNLEHISLERLQEIEQERERMKKMRYENYLKLKAEFEPGAKE
jgi:hypothetical protein